MKTFFPPMRLSMIYLLDSSVLEILDWCVSRASRFRLTFAMQCLVTKKSVRGIFASQFQSSLLCVFWKGKFPPVPLSSARRLINQIAQDCCRIALPNTYEVSFAVFGLKFAWDASEIMYIWTICHLNLNSNFQHIISPGLIQLFGVPIAPLHCWQDWFSLVIG